MLGGLDWTGTALGQAFKAQEQVLFLFASIIFIVSVILHMISIPEKVFVPSRQIQGAGSGDSMSNSFFTAIGHTPPSLDVIKEEDSPTSLAKEEDRSVHEDGEMDFLAVDRMRSKSDSVLAMADSTIELDSDLDPGSQLFLPEVHHFLPDTQEDLEDVFKPSEHSIGSSSPSGGLPTLTEETAFFEPSAPALPELISSTHTPNSPLQKNPASEDSHQKTQVKSLDAHH